MTRLRLAALALVVVLAGCPGPQATGSPTPTATATDTATATVTATPSSLAPGVTDAGLTDVEALLAAHRSTLLSSGATLSLDVTRTEPGGTVSQRSSQTVALGPDAATVALNGSGLGPDGPLRVDAWLTDDRSLYRFTDDAGSTYRVTDPLAGRDVLVGAGNIEQYIRAAPASFTVDSTEMADDSRVTTLTATADLVNDSAGDDTEMTMTVSERGVIRSFDLEQTQPDGDTYTLAYRVQSVGASPAEPTWVGSVPDGVFLDTDLAVAVTNDTLVNISNAGPDAVPANASVTVAAGGTVYDLTLTDPLPPGETRWLWVDDASGTLTAATERPASTSARALGGQATVVVRTADGTTLVTADLAWRPGR